MKLKKYVIISMSFVLFLIFSIAPVFASTTTKLGYYNIGGDGNSEIVMTENVSKIIFTAYFEDGEEISSYFDKITKKVYLDGCEVKYSYKEGHKIKEEISVLPYTNIDSTPVNVITGINIDFAPLIEASAKMATKIALAHCSVTAADLLVRLTQTAINGHWDIVINKTINNLVGYMGGWGVSKILNITFTYDLQRTKGLIYLDGGSVPVTGYRYANYRAEIKVAGKKVSGSSGKHGGWWSSSKPYSINYE